MTILLAAGGSPVGGDFAADAYEKRVNRKAESGSGYFLKKGKGLGLDSFGELCYNSKDVSGSMKRAVACEELIILGGKLWLVH